MLGVGKKRGDYEFQQIGGQRMEKFGRLFMFPFLAFHMFKVCLLLPFVGDPRLFGSVDFARHLLTSGHICAAPAAAALHDYYYAEFTQTS